MGERMYVCDWVWHASRIAYTKGHSYMGMVTSYRKGRRKKKLSTVGRPVKVFYIIICEPVVDSGIEYSRSWSRNVKCVGRNVAGVSSCGENMKHLFAKFGSSAQINSCSSVYAIVLHKCTRTAIPFRVLTFGWRVAEYDDLAIPAFVLERRLMA